jgi:hypothetical protein
VDIRRGKAIFGRAVVEFGAVAVLLTEGEIWVEIWVKIGLVVGDLSEDLVGSDASLRNALMVAVLMVDLAGGC